MYIIDTMVRNRKPSSKVKLSDEMLHQAISDVKEKKLSLRAAADCYGIAKSTLARLVNKTGSDGTIIIKHDRRQVFTTDQEHKLLAYASRWVNESYGAPVSLRVCTEAGNRLSNHMDH